MAASSNMTRSKPVKRKVNHDGLGQIQDLTFNLYGWAFDAPADLYGEPITVTARPPSSTTYRDAIKKAKNSGLPESPGVIGPSQREREPPGPGFALYLHIGWVPLNQEEKHAKRATGPKISGTVRPRGKDILKTENQPPLMVVAKVSTSLALSTILYALVCPVDGICKPCIVSQDEVFYLPAFRDLTTNIRERRLNWNRLIAEASYKPEGNPRERQKRIKTTPADQEDLASPKVDSFKDKGSLLFSSFEQAGVEGSFKELSDVFQQLSETLLHPLTQCEDIAQFMTVSGGITDFEFNSQKFVDAINGMWLDLAITAQEAESVRASIHRQQLSLSYRDLKPFLVETLHQIRSIHSETAPGESDVDDTIKTALATAKRLLPTVIAADSSATKSKFQIFKHLK